LLFRSKPVAVLSLVLVLAGSLGGWHTPDDVDDYAPLAQSLTASNAQVTTQTPSTPEHCALCHWLQALSKAAPVTPQALAAESFDVIRDGALAERIRTTSLFALPSRAPPRA
jgi:hypothetical protein